MVNVPISFRVLGGDQAVGDFDDLFKSVAKTRVEIEKFSKSGSLGALSAGKVEINAAAARLDVLAVEARQAELSIESLWAELKKPDGQRKKPLIDIQHELITTTARAEELRAELKRLPIELKRTVVANSVDFLGDLGTGFSSLGGATAGLGGSVLGRIGGMGLQTGVGPLAQVGGGFQLAGDLFDVAEALPRMSSALSIAKSSALDFVAASGGLTGAFSKLASTIGPMAGTALAAAGAYALMNMRLGETEDLAQENIKFQNERLKLLRFERDELAKLSGMETTSKIGDLQSRISEETTARDELIASLSSLYGEASYAEILNAISNGDTDTGPVVDVLAAISDLAVSDSSGGIASTIKEIEKYNTSIGEQESQLAALNAVLADKQLSDQLLAAGASIDAQVKAQIERQQVLATASSESLLEQVATNNLEIEVRQRNIEAGKALLATLEPSSEAYRTLSTILGDNTNRVVALQSQNQQLNESTIALVIGRERETALMEKQKTLLDSLADNRQRANELDKQRADLLAEQAAKESRQAEEGALKASQSERLALKNQELANAQESQKAREQAAKLASIRQQGTDKEADILAKLQASEGQALNKLNTSIGKINTDFMRSELKAVQAFRTEELDRTEDYNRERLKLVTDLSASLLEAATDNDVNAFISAQQAGLASLGELDTNFGVTGARSSRDFGMARNEAAQNREQQVADLQATYQAEQMERRRAAQVQLDETRAATEAQLAQTRESGKAVMTEVQRIQEEIQALQLQFQRETGELAARYEREAGQKRLNALQQSSLQLAGEYARLNQQLVANSTAIANNVGASFVNGVADTMQRLIGQVFGQQQGVTVNVGNVQMGSIATPEYVNGQLGALSQAVMGGLTASFQGSR